MEKPSLPDIGSCKVLNKIFDYLLPKATETVYDNEKYQILPDGTFDEADFITLITDTSLKKPWKNYKVIQTANFYEEKQFIDYQKKAEEIKKANQEYLEWKRQRDERKLNLSVGEEWQIIQQKYDFARPIDKNWIINNIGELLSETEYANAAVIFSLLDKSEWCLYKNSIYISRAIYSRIIKIPSKWWEDDIFKAFEYNYYRKKQLIKTRVVFYFPTDNARPRGVYGVWVNEELFYIGSTNRSFEDRFDEHQRNLYFNNKELSWYSKINYDIDEIEFKPIIDITQLKCDKELDATDIKSMEYALILAYQPKGNIAGRIVPFKYN